MSEKVTEQPDWQAIADELAGILRIHRPCSCEICEAAMRRHQEAKGS